MNLLHFVYLVDSEAWTSFQRENLQALSGPAMRGCRGVAVRPLQATGSPVVPCPGTGGAAGAFCRKPSLVGQPRCENKHGKQGQREAADSPPIGCGALNLKKKNTFFLFFF